MALLRGETVTMETDWFTLQDARLQLKPYSEPNLEVAVAASISPTGATRRRQARHRAALDRGDDASRASTRSARTGRRGTRSPPSTATPPTATKWRLVGPMHLAETKEQARNDVEYGIVPFSHYFTHVLPGGPDARRHRRGDHRQRRRRRLRGDRHTRRRDRARSSRSSTSRAASARSCCSVTTGRHPAATKRSFELFAQYVMPHFTGQLDAPAGVVRLGHRQRRRVREPRRNAIMKAIADHAAQQQPT